MAIPQFDAHSLHLRPADEILQESEAFFMREGKVYSAMKRLASDLDEEGIPYVIVGGMALNLWGYARQTVDVDILLTPEGLLKFKERLLGRGYVPAFANETRSFCQVQTQVLIEILTAGDYPGDGKPKSVVFPDPAEVSLNRDGYRVITLEKLIELKLASGLSAPHRGKDLVDVQELIAILDLPLELTDRLDQTVRDEYRRRWDLAHYADDANR